MKKLLIFIICIAMLIMPLTVRADNNYAECVYHCMSGKIVAENNSAERFSVAGLARLPALIIIAEAVESGELPLDKEITVSKKAASISGSTAFIKAGELITAEKLFKSAAMICAGDATYALGEAVAGSNDAFCERVNSMLSDMGIDASYTNINDDTPLSAKDLAMLGARLSKCKEYLKYSSVYMDSITHETGTETELVNSNRLIKTLSGCRGLVTGSSASSNYCGVFYVSRNSYDYIAVVTGAKNSQERFAKATDLLETAYAGYKQTVIAEKGDTLMYDYPIKGAMLKSCEIVAANDAAILADSSQGEPQCSYNMPDTLTAPVKAGDIVGNAVYSDSNGNVICTVELTVKNDIDQARFFDFFLYVLFDRISK